MPSKVKILFPSTRAAKYKFSLSISVALKLYENMLSSSIDWLSTKSREGGSLTGLTVKIKFVESVNSPSVTETEISTSPKKSSSGVIVSWSPFTIKEVLPSIALNVKSSPSISSADNVIVNDESSLISWFSIVDIIGESLTGFTVIVIIPLSEDKEPSVALNKIISLPLKSWFGV